LDLIRFATEKEDAPYLAQVEASDKGHPQGEGAFKTNKGLSPLGTLQSIKSPCKMEDNFEQVNFDYYLSYSQCEISY